MKRGEIWWANLPDPVASEPGFRRPLLIIQIDEFNRSIIKTSHCPAVPSPGSTELNGQVGKQQSHIPSRSWQKKCLLSAPGGA